MGKKKAPAAEAESTAQVEAKPAPRKKPIFKSGNAGNSASSSVIPREDTSNKLFGSWTGKVPLTLLNEHAQKRGWDRPVVDAKRIAGSQGFSCIVILKRPNPKDPHGQHDSVLIKPPKEVEDVKIDCPTAIEARHMGATLALFRFANNLNLRSTLPPAARDYWTKLEGWKLHSPKNKSWLFDPDPFTAAANSPFSASKANDATPTDSARSSRPPSPKLPKFWQGVPEVRMSPARRQQVQDLIQSHMDILGNDAGDDAQQEFEEQDGVRNSLLRLGFRQGHVENAFSYLRQAQIKKDPVSLHLAQLPQQDALIEYLQLVLPEDDLPSAFRQTHSNLANARIASSSDSVALARNWTIERIHKDHGYPSEIINACLKEANGNEALCMDLLLDRLVGRSVRPTTPKTHVDEALLDEEIVTLESIYSDRFASLGERHFEIMIPLEHTSTRNLPDELSLCVWLQSTSSYPSAEGPHNFPTFACKSHTLPSYIRLHLTSLLYNRLQEQDMVDMCNAGTGGVVSELVEYLSEHAQAVIISPPDPASVMQYLAPRPVLRPKQASFTSKTKAKERSKLPSPTMNSEILKQLQVDTEKTTAYQTMLKKRQALPSWTLRERIIKTIGSSRVTLISGETGSGKSTQVPAYIMEDALGTGTGADCSIIVTQPRRVAAIGVATRVAAERGESIGTSSGLVGYSIRGESRGGPDCRLRFVTTGVLLRRMMSDPSLVGISHVFVDEVHERSVDSDFLLLELKTLLKANSKIKVILMSATIQQSTFEAYFGSPPSVSIPGRTFPVQDYYLEDIVQLTSFQPKSAKAARNYTKDQQEDMKSFFLKQGIDDPDYLSTLGMLSRSQAVDFELLARTVELVQERLRGIEGAVLVFVSGVGEIAQATTAIRSAVPSVTIIPLHAQLPPDEQMKAFSPVRSGRKIIVSTNVAETSLTIEDVICVIDTGKVKETRYDAENNLSRLEEVYTSRASSRQRRGRAGRVREGECWKLYSRWTEERDMAAFGLPEILRTPLEQVVLSVKASKESNIDAAGYMKRLITPPADQAIQGAISVLVSLGAIDAYQNITPLGRILASLPLDLRLGKMIVLGVCFKALEPALYLAAMLSSKPLFLTILEKRDEVKSARSNFAANNSDIVTNWTALKAALAAEEGSKRGSREFCEQNCISMSAFIEIKKLAVEYFAALQGSGLLSYRSSFTHSAYNSQQKNERLLNAILFASTNNLARARVPEARELQYFDDVGRVFIHPTSMLFHTNKLKSGFLTWFNKQITSKPFLRDVAEVSHWAILLLSTLNMKAETHGIVLENNMRLKCWSRIGHLSSQMRRLLAAELEDMFENPTDARAELSPVVDTMLQLITDDGA